MTCVHEHSPSRQAPAQCLASGWLRVFLVIGTLAAGGCAATTPALPQYQVGDTVIARHFTGYPQYNGTPVRVTGGYQWRWIKGNNTLRCYSVTTVDGQELAAQAFQLQRLVVQR